MTDESVLTVELWSFSYKKGPIPSENIHGGGFVFDCRCLPNPGREAEYALFTGLDEPVQRYLAQYAEVERFEKACEALVLQAIESYRERGFTSLLVAFGCTGGQHRSVYFVHRLAKKIANLHGIAVVECHRELDRARELAQ